MSSLDPLRPDLYSDSTANWSEERWTKLKDLVEGRDSGGQAEAAITVACAGHARSVVEATRRHVGGPSARPADKIEYARLLHGQGNSYGGIRANTGFPKASLHQHMGGGRYDA